MRTGLTARIFVVLNRGPSVKRVFLDTLNRTGTMSSTLTISIPERLWLPIADAPQDGTMIFIRDENGNVDLAVWNNNEWNCELGMLEYPVQFVPVSIANH